MATTTKDPDIVDSFTEFFKVEFGKGTADAEEDTDVEEEAEDDVETCDTCLDPVEDCGCDTCSGCGNKQTNTHTTLCEVCECLDCCCACYWCDPGSHNFDPSDGNYCETCDTCAEHCDDEHCDDEHESDDDEVAPGKTLSTQPPWVARGLTFVYKDVKAILDDIAPVVVHEYGDKVRVGDAEQFVSVEHRDAWSKFWPIDNENIDPVQTMAEFYLLDGIAGMVFNGSREVSHDPSALVIAEEAKAMQQDLIDWLDPSFRNYADMAIGGELRHHHAIPKDGENRVMSHTRGLAWLDWKAIRDKVGVDALKDASELFREQAGNIGGWRWATAADILHDRLTGKLDKRTFVDRVFTLQHNGGAFINKIRWAVNNPPKWQMQTCKTVIGPAHAANPTMFGPLLVVSRSEVASLLREWWVQTNKIRRQHGLPLVPPPSVFDGTKGNLKTDGYVSWQPTGKGTDAFNANWFLPSNMRLDGAPAGNTEWTLQQLSMLLVADHIGRVYMAFIPEPHRLDYWKARATTRLLVPQKIREGSISSSDFIAAVSIVDNIGLDVVESEVHGTEGDHWTHTCWLFKWWWGQHMSSEMLAAADAYEKKQKPDEWAYDKPVPAEEKLVKKGSIKATDLSYYLDAKYVASAKHTAATWTTTYTTAVTNTSGATTE